MDKRSRAEFVKQECEDAVEQALTKPHPPARRPKVRPETCGSGSALARLPDLSQLDGDDE